MIRLSGDKGESFYNDVVARCEKLNIVEKEKLKLSDLRVLEDCIVSLQ